MVQPKRNNLTAVWLCSNNNMAPRLEYLRPPSPQHLRNTSAVLSRCLAPPFAAPLILVPCIIKGMLFGAIFWSVYADKHGRQRAFLLSLICFVVAGLATALAWSANAVIVLRTIVGFGVGGNIPVTNVLLAEFLPTSQRGAVICRVIGVIVGLGIALLALVGLALSRALGPG